MLPLGRSEYVACNFEFLAKIQTARSHYRKENFKETRNLGALPSRNPPKPFPPLSPSPPGMVSLPPSFFQAPWALLSPL